MARWPKLGDEVTFDIHIWSAQTNLVEAIEITASIVGVDKFRDGRSRYAVTSTDPLFLEHFPFRTREYTGELVNVGYRGYKVFKTFGPPNVDTEEKLTRLLERQYG